MAANCGLVSPEAKPSREAGAMRGASRSGVGLAIGRHGDAKSHLTTQLRIRGG